MLAHLKIRNFVLIDELDLALGPGFNVLTGETGAGKSLIAAALDMLLGRRGSGNLVRRGESEAEIEGLFDISDEPGVQKRLAQADLGSGSELLVRRVIPANGRHRCYINGRLASLGLLAEVAEELARMMGQHEQLSLLAPARQLELLDGFGGLEPMAGEMALCHREVREAESEVERLRGLERDRAARLDYLAFQVEEIDRLAPVPGEIGELDREIGRMRHRAEIVAAARNAVESLYEAEGAAFEKLGTSARELAAAARYDDALEPAARQIGEAAVLVEEAARSLRGYGREADLDPSELPSLEERRGALQSLVRKHGADLEAVLRLREEWRGEFAALGAYEETMAAAVAALEEKQEKAREHAGKLSETRRRAARRLAAEVTAQLADLEFGKAEFLVQLDPQPSGIGPTGADRAEFLVALNPGEGAHPLRTIASGGELSRLMLAVKRALAGVGPVGTYVFDEVDAGIGGAVAAAVGRKLREVARHHQVICITHLPQIAGMADTHLQVLKEPRDGRTTTRIVTLGHEERVEELARMLGGEKVSKKTREAARELIST